MTQPLAAEEPKPVRSPSRRQSVAVRRIRYVSGQQPGTKARWKFEQPRACVVVEEAVELTDLRPDAPRDAPTDAVTLALLPTDATSESKRLGESWMVPLDGPGAVPTIAFASNNCKIQWRPGKAIIQGPPEGSQRVVEALVEFAFLEGELRHLERSLEEQEALAPADVPRAHRIRLRDHKEWRRIGETIEWLYRMRLTYGRLEAQFAIAPHVLPRESRQVLERLVEEAGIDHRMEGFSNRLEGCEDLYEGANDRIADYHWYLEGTWMEAAIIVLLVVEIALMAGDIYLRHAK